MTLAPCPLCGTQTNPGAACFQCGTPIPADVTGPQAYATYWEGILSRLRRVAAPKYQVKSVLGYGGMAGVFLADEPRLGRRVALKVMSPALMADPKLVERFVQEARTIALLSHPNIVTIFEVDEREDLHWFTMSYVGGRTLGQVMTESLEPLPIDVVRAWLFQIADALSYAHQNGIVHRDIKPGNVLIDLRGNALVTDFGIAKVADVEAGLTRTGMLVGTPTYMSPEQCTSGDVTGASDQYSLGAVLYQMLTGEPPFAGATLSVLQAHVTDEPTPIRHLRPDCPPELAQAVHRMLAKRPEQRWPSMAALIDAAGATPPGIESPIRKQLELLAAPAALIGVAHWHEVVREGARERVHASVRDAVGREITGRRITWSSSAPVVAGITADATVWAFCPGDTHISITCDGTRTVLPLRVEEDAVRGLELRPSKASVAAGAELPLEATVYDLDGTRLEDRAVYWSSSDPHIARVSYSGVVRGLAEGEVAIIARTGGKSAAVSIQVTGSITGRPPASRTTRAGMTGPAIADRTPSGAMPAGRTASGATRAGRTAAGATVGGGAALPVVDSSAAPAPRRRHVWIAAAAIVVALGVIGAVMVIRSNEPAPVVVDAARPASGPPSVSPAPAAPAAPLPAAPDPAGSASAGPGGASAGPGSATPAPIAPAAPATPDPRPPAESRPAEGTIGVAGDLPGGTTIVVRDASGRTTTLRGRSASLAPGTYVLEARAAGYESYQETVIVRAGTALTWAPRLRQLPAAQPAPRPAAPPPAAPPQPVDTRADEVAIDAVVRRFVSAFHARDSAAVVPLLPANLRTAYGRLLNDERNVSAFSASLESIQPIRVEGDAGTVEFVVAVSFRNQNQANRLRHPFIGRAERSGSGWRIVSLRDAGS